MSESPSPEKQTLEERRLALEESRFAKDSSFFAKHAGPIVIALIGGLFSWAQIQVAQIQKDRELQVTELQKNKELALATLERERRWQLDLSEFVFKHRDLIFSKDAVEREHIRNVLVTTFPPELTKRLFQNVENVVPPEQKSIWEEGQSVADYNRAVSHMQEGRYDQAIVELTQLIKSDSSNINAYYNRGSAYMKIGDYDKAIHDFNEVITQEPSRERAYYNRAVIYNKTGQKDKAIDDFKKVLELSSDTTLRQRAEANLRALGVR